MEPPSTETISHQLLYQNDAQTPLGRLRLAGGITAGRGIVPAHPMRVYGSYAVMCLLRGAGRYRDAGGIRCDLRAGNAVLVFPELAHWYGPRRGQPGWDEFYLTFDGPVFDQWREAGLLEMTRPILQPGEALLAAWVEQVRRLLEQRLVTSRERARQVAEFAALLGDLLRASETETDSPAAVEGDTGDTGNTGVTPSPPSSTAWLGQARQMLETNLARDLPPAEVAASVHQSYETFRKRFREMVGVTPARYRAIRRIEAAQALLRYTPGITNREIAQILGFADEFHFSRRFTQIAGATPRDFRQGVGRTERRAAKREPETEREKG
ncbi:MAG: helix-turn-helix transcriptional regulator [Cytophagales bacterium]|nr:helix-turn-helix transcriptional regulator [Armatimonadota bacterium]